MKVVIQNVSTDRYLGEKGRWCARKGSQEFLPLPSRARFLFQNTDIR